MAILEKLELVNFAQHRHRVLELGPGLVVLAGAMGSGKTNLMLSALGSLINHWGLFPAAKDKLICRSAAASEPAYVASTWRRQDGLRLRVVRGFQRMGSALEVDGEVVKTCRTELQITAEVARLLGIQPEQLMKHHLVLQSQTGGIVEAKPTDRVRFFAQVLDCEWLLELQKAAEAELQWARGATAGDVSLQLRELIRKRHAWRLEREKVKQQRDQFRSNILTPEELEKCRQLLVKRDLRQSLINERQQLSSELAKQQASLKAAQETLADHDQSGERRREELRDMQRQLEQYRVWQGYQQLHKNLEASGGRIQFLKDKLASPPSCCLKFTPENERQLSSFYSECVEIERRLQLLAAGERVCSNCGQMIPDLNADDPEELKRWLTTRHGWLRAEIASREKTKVAIQTHAKLLEQFEKDSVTWQRELATEEESLKVTQQSLARDYQTSPTQSGVTPERAQQLRKQLADLEKVVGGYEQLRRSKAEAVTRLQTQIEVTEENLAKVATRLKELPPLNDAQSREAERLMALQKELIGDLAEVEKEIKLLDGELIGINAQLRNGVALMRQQKRSLQWRELVERLADEARPVNLPKRVLGSQLEQLSGPISIVCSQMGLPFRISASAQLEFLAEHLDGSVEPAACLSGGQKACVAIAFWIAKLVRVRSGLASLFLDEPAANLDAAAVAQLGLLLSALGERLAAAGKQVVLSTHHRQLMDVGQFSQLIS